MRKILVVRILVVDPIPPAVQDTVGAAHSTCTYFVQAVGNNKHVQQAG